MQTNLVSGSAGSVTLSFSQGKASLSASAALDQSALSLQAAIVVDAGSLIDQLEAIVAKAIPSTAAIDPAIFAVIKQAVLSIG